MIKQLRLQGLRADLGAARTMLAGAEKAGDPVGMLQFQKKIDALEQELAELAGATDKLAKVAVFFGGRPVIGSRGVDAEFASKAMDSFQKLVSRQFARMEAGDLGSRGPVPVQGEARLMITDVARGSVGFVLEEAPEQSQMVETELAVAIEQISDAISRLGGDGDEWADTIEQFDDRVVACLKEFFSVLDEGGATFRIVEGSRDREVSHAEISRARSRADLTRIAQEQTGWIEGQIVGFTSKSFEFAPVAGEKLTGRMDPGPARLLEKAGMQHELDKLLFTPTRAKFQVRTVANGSLIRRYHTLIAIDDRSVSD